MSDSSIAISDLQQTEQQPEDLTILGLLTGVIIRPRRTFVSLREAKQGHWWIVFVITILTLALLTFSTTSIQMKSMQNFMPPEGVEIPEEAAAAAAPTSMLLVFSMGLIGGVIGTLVKYLLSTSLIFGLGFVFGGKTTFKQMFRMVVWTTLPVAIRYLVQAIASLITGNPPVAGLSAAMTTMESMSMPILSSMLGQIDAYLVWSMILLGIGVSATTKLSKGKTALLVCIYLLIVGGILMGLSWAGQAITSQFTGGGGSGPGRGGGPR